jgi:hypothetical protein
VCLNCDFRRDLSQHYQGGFGALLLGALAFAVVLALAP